MDKSRLKRFATQLRRDLIEEIRGKIAYITSLSDEQMPAFYRNFPQKVHRLKEETQKIGIEDLSEKVAYMWANRLIALRYMDIKKINSPLVVSPKENETTPEIFALAKEGIIDEKLPIDKEKFFDLIDGKINAEDPENEAYGMLFIAICNHYYDTFPFLFEQIDNYTELLLPTDMLSKNSIRAKVVDAISPEDAKDVEIIGWLYQFYIAEKKDEIFQNFKKNKKAGAAEIPAATQLFTPHWIVRYLVENSLGRLWLCNHPDSNLKEQMPYYIENDTKTCIQISSPEEITFLDPCCGSGHMLTYAFDLLTKIYEEEGYPKSEIPRRILQNNLYGCDIDQRAASLASFALMMKAIEYDKRFLQRGVLPNIVALQDFGIEELKDIDVVGSLIKIEDAASFDEGVFGHSSKEFALQSHILGSQFHCTVTNPPYMGSKNMNQTLKDYLAKHYPDSKSDLFAAFIERCLDFTQERGFTAMITMQSWMFLSSFEKLRIKILKKYTIKTLAHLGNMVMGIAFGTSAFVLQKVKPDKDSTAIYFRIDLKDLDENREIKSLK